MENKRIYISGGTLIATFFIGQIPNLFMNDINIQGVWQYFPHVMAGVGVFLIAGEWVWWKYIDIKSKHDNYVKLMERVLIPEELTEDKLIGMYLNDRDRFNELEKLDLPLKTKEMIQAVKTAYPVALIGKTIIEQIRKGKP